GFTLVELMIVVAIVGILATLAVVGYRKLVQSSHVSEATGMVQNIRVAQEGYHSETQTYANVSNSLADYYPAAPKYGTVTVWGAPCTNCKDVPWAVLPVHVDGPVAFGYATVAGRAGDAIPAAPNVAANPFPANVTTDWYVVAADGDLDGNSTEPNNTHVLGASWTNQIIVDREGQ
ncbi:MAG TPA: prepilin-type N-terminal cleavage/methylation domain-containing protein, partial [Chloroflexota bacterium]|nr:prepilin-type N-terminal cleavage/methylation domain-containing protein [Chloroflexota bacterium]